MSSDREPLHNTARVNRLGLTIDVDPHDLEQKKWATHYRLNVVEIPILRVLGFLLLSLAILIHNKLILESFSVQSWLAVTILMLTYAVASWLALYLFFSRVRAFDLGVFFLVMDIPVWLLGIYASGADRSWLFFILLLRVADQINTSLKRALVFAHLITVFYLGFISYLDLVENRPIRWGAETAKVIFLYGSSLYASFTAKAALERRQRTTAAIRMARNLIRQLEEKSKQLEDLRIKAEEASQAKSEFLANMSHEMRTPLNAILGMTQIALDSEITTEQRRSLETVRESADSLLAVINDILDFSKVEARKLDLETVEFHLRDTLYGIIKTLGFHAYRKGLELICDVHPDVPDKLVGDAPRLRQVVVNLLGNAIKFTEKGQIVLNVETTAINGDRASLHFKVADTGIGIAEEKQKMIFEAFVQADGSNTRKYGGTGLGLSISSRLIELMDGAIWVESGVERGSTFHFTARFQLQPGARTPFEPPLEAAILPVLVIDDNETCRRVTSEVLKSWKMRAVEAADGREGLAAIERAREGGLPYSIVFLDVGMSDLDGFTVAERVMSTGNAQERLILLLPYAGDLRGAARCRDLGVAGYITKPVISSEILDAVTSVLGLTTVQILTRPLSQKNVKKAQRALRVLLAEDNPVNQAVAVGLLERWGHEVSVAFDGREVLAFLENDTFDLIIMDVQMPEMDGFQATQEIRRRETGSNYRLPIIAMTAHAMKGDRDRCFAAGMDAYIVKPVDQQELFDVIEWFGSNGAATTAAPPVQTERSRSSVLEHFDNDLQFAKSVCRLFLDNYPRMLTEIRQALDRGDTPALKMAAHTLKGAVGNFPAEGALKAAARLEELAIEGNLSEGSAVCDLLENELEQFKPSLTTLVSA